VFNARSARIAAAAAVGLELIAAAEVGQPHPAAIERPA
jgi:hypothetical protein